MLDLAVMIPGQVTTIVTLRLLLEAMAVGLPIVATDVGAAGEMLGRHYPLVRPKDELDFRVAVENMEARLAAGEPVGQSLLERCRNNFSLDQVASRYVELYRSLSNPVVSEKTAIGWLTLLKQLKGTLLESES